MAAHALAPAVFVGVDSGGTRTNITIRTVDDGGETSSSSYEMGETLSGALAPELVAPTLRRILAPLEARIEADGSRVYVWISAAGFSAWTRETYFSSVRDVRPTLLEGRIVSIGVGNDAVSLLLGSRADGIVIAGTGSSVIVRSRDGELYQVGGHEWVATDYGSGFWIGLRAIREAYHDFEDGRDSVLLQRMHEIYGVRHGDDRGLIQHIRDLAVGDPNTKKEIAKFAVAVCAAAERGDKASQNIVKAQAEDLADVTAKGLRRRFQRAEMAAGLRIVQCGSLINNGFYRTSFEAQLEMRLLSGPDPSAVFEWERVVTASDAAAQLAADLMTRSDQYLKLDTLFRPVVLNV